MAFVAVSATREGNLLKHHKEEYRYVSHNVHSLVRPWAKKKRKKKETPKLIYFFEKRMIE